MLADNKTTKKPPGMMTVGKLRRASRNSRTHLADLQFSLRYNIELDLMSVVRKRDGKMEKKFR